MELKQIFADLKIKVNAEQLTALEQLITVKKTPRAAQRFAFVQAVFEDKTPLQMKQCVECLKDVGHDVDMKEWAELLGQYDGFKTRQTPERIIAFYRKRMINEGQIQAA